MTPDALAVIKRADQRWATKHSDDTAPVAYLEHLATALAPLLQPGAAPVDLDQATELEKVRADLTSARLQLDDKHGDLRAATAENEGLYAEIAGLSTTIEQLRAELDATRLDLEATRLTAEGARRDLATARAEIEHLRPLAENWTAGLAGSHDVLRADLDGARALLGRLVDAISEEWRPDGDHSLQVDRAIDLVAAAHDQLQQRHNTGQHVHTYERTPAGRHKPCTCGKPFPGKQPTTQRPKKGAA